MMEGEEGKGRRQGREGKREGGGKEWGGGE